MSLRSFGHAVGERLTSIQCHSIMCKIGDIVVAGGVRRSACISLSNPSDDRMRDAKSGNWYTTNTALSSSRTTPRSGLISRT